MCKTRYNKQDLMTQCNGKMTVKDDFKVFASCKLQFRLMMGKTGVRAIIFVGVCQEFTFGSVMIGVLLDK